MTQKNCVLEKHGSTRDILRKLSQKWMVRAVDLSERNIDPEVGTLLPKELVKQQMLIPFARENGTVLLAARDPRNLNVFKEIESRFGIKVIPYLALGSDIRRAIAHLYGEGEFSAAELDRSEQEGDPGVSSDELEITEKQTQKLLLGLDSNTGSIELEVEKSDTVQEILQIDMAAPEVERMTNVIILEAIRLNASDIHIEPFEKKILVRYRVDGELRESTFKIPFVFRNALIAKLKIMGGLNIAERRIPQDGRLAIKINGRPYELRLNVIPTIQGESAVLRILDRSGANLTLDQLGFLPDTQEQFLKSLQKPYGLILVCGPTGSGKSFTLMASLSAVRNPKEKILTAENPVEYNLEGVVQVQVNPDLSLGEGKRFDFAAALRAFLRQDPDTIMVGEIRDKETGHVACEAAMTGHLVLSTIHTNDATSVISRLAEMGVPPYLVGSTLECVLSQRLVRTLCQECKQPDPAPDPQLFRLLDEYKIDWGNATFMKPKGCPKCGNEGMKGRTAIHELLKMDSQMRAICKPGIKNDEVRAVAVQSGMRSLLIDGLIKVTQGFTTFAEVIAAA